MFRLLGASLMMAVSSLAAAQGFWLPATDERLRDDLNLLVDEGLMDLPAHTWPMPGSGGRAR